MKHLFCLLVFALCLAGPFSAIAEDVDIYMGRIEVQPNVLIVFDTSASMKSQDAVPDEPYVPGFTYSGAYNRNSTYAYSQNSIHGTGSWAPFWNSINFDNCAKGSTELYSEGAVDIRLNTSPPYSCSGSFASRTIATGNYVNYLNTRLDVAKKAVAALVDSASGVRFGLMEFNVSGAGGRVVANIGAVNVKRTVNNLNANVSATPLAESLAEAGLYFAGKGGWFNSGRYSSPIMSRCQRNYVILVTDGVPTNDNGVNGKRYMSRSEPVLADTGATGSYLDDIADYLHNTDLLPALGAEDDFEKQTVTTYTIGFKTDQALLESAAQRGGGAYYTAHNSAALTDAFYHILEGINDSNASFVAPAAPVSRSNRTFVGDRVFLGFFKPQIDGRWRGNLKAYKLTDSGEYLDQNSQPVTDADGMIIASAQSLWSTMADGYEVDEGGAGEQLVANDSRNIYTYLDGETPSQKKLTHAENAFTGANARLSDEFTTLLGYSPATTSALITTVRAESHDWPMGDVVHSEPVAQHHYVDSNNDGRVTVDEIKTYIYVGANDGMLHAFDGDDGSEAWAFIPPGQLPRLDRLTNGKHDYFVDGSLSLLGSGSVKTLLFGERRGGSKYYALDVTDPTDPVWKYEIPEDALANLDWDADSTLDGAGGRAMLGQSWSRPQAVRMKIGSEVKNVFLLTGGYDTNQDNDPPASRDSSGRAIYTIDVATGAVTGLNVNDGLWPAMTHCILDAAAIDRNGDGLVNRVYAGDLGGHILALRDDDYDGVWERHMVFDLPVSVIDHGRDVKLGQKFMYAPEVAAEPLGEILYIGSGDRENPTSTAYVDAFYAIHSTWLKNASNRYGTLSTTDLVDVTDNAIQQGTEEEKAQVRKDLQAGSGWYFRMPNTGEKIVSTPVLFNKTVYFTTFTPTTEALVSSDPCISSFNHGVARLYAVDYLTGAATKDYFKDSSNPDALTREDRSVVVGTSMPSAPVVSISKGGVRIKVGVEGGVRDEDTGFSQTVHQYFWRQIQ